MLSYSLGFVFYVTSKIHLTKWSDRQSVRMPTFYDFSCPLQLDRLFMASPAQGSLGNRSYTIAVAHPTHCLLITLPGIPPQQGTCGTLETGAKP